MQAAVVEDIGLTMECLITTEALAELAAAARVVAQAHR